MSSVEVLVAQIRDVVIKRAGCNGIRALGRSFRIMDDNGNHALSQQEFQGALESFGVQLSEKDWLRLFNTFDTNHDGNVDVNEFLLLLRGSLNARREAVVKLAFQKFDKNGSGEVDLDDLRGTYDVSRNPFVLKGEASPDAMLREFLDTFDKLSCSDGIVTWEEFANYYAGLSSGIDEDELFELIVLRAWNLDGAALKQKGVVVETPAMSTGSRKVVLANLQTGEPLPVPSRPLVASGGEQWGTASTRNAYISRYKPASSTRVFLDFTAGGEPLGRVIFELYVAIAPKTSDNFRALCTGERGRSTSAILHYKGIRMHRVVPKFVAQGGDITRSNGKGGESIYGKRFEDESFQVKHDAAGVLSMANTGPNSNNSQFFITLAPAPYLDGKHCAFGKVLEGMNVVEALSTLGSQQGTPLKEIVIADCGTA